jgi:glycosyltransferase involved in cell wall biosynthesis
LKDCGGKASKGTDERSDGNFGILHNRMKVVVTTSAAVQSIKPTLGVHLLIEDNFDKFTEAVFRLIENNTLRNYLGTNARQFVKSNYNWQTNMKKLENLLL